MKRGLIILIIVILVLILGVFIIFYNFGDNENSSLNKIKEMFVNGFQSNQTLNNSEEFENNSEDDKIGEDINCYSAGQSFDSSQNSEAECCEGLVEKSQYDLRNCIVLPSTKLTCVNCGDSVCGEGENNCNCDEDCG